MSDDIATLLDRSSALYEALDEHLNALAFESTPRFLLALPLCGIAMEHGASVCMLSSANQVTSVTALLRIQLEAVVRALWLLFAAKEEWIDKYHDAIRNDPTKNPNTSPTVDAMLTELNEAGPPGVASQLAPFKKAAWGPMNSFVHAGIHPIVYMHAGYSSEHVTGNVRNANGLTGMAAMAVATMTGDPQMTRSMKDLQMAFLDCMPPLNS